MHRAFQRGPISSLVYLPEINPGMYQLIVKNSAGKPIRETNLTLGEGLTLMRLGLKENPQHDSLASPATALETPRPITVPFTQSSYTLDEKAIASLDSLARFLSVNHQFIARLTGHTDDVGKRDLNLTLSEYRTRVIAAHLRRKGVSEEQIHYVAKGSEEPVAPNDTEANKSKNRRVVILIVKNE